MLFVVVFSLRYINFFQTGGKSLHMDSLVDHTSIVVLVKPCFEGPILS